MDQKKKYLFGKNICVLDLDANTPGNTNAHCIDSSMFAGAGAVQANALYQPVLTNDVFGVGRKGYVFDGVNDVMTVQNTPNLNFGNGIKDNAFTVEFTFIFYNTVRSTGLLAKIDVDTGKYEWAFYYYQNSIRTYIYSGGTTANFIARRTDFTGEINKEYAFKMTYDGSGMYTGIRTYLDGTVPPFYASVTGTYVAMSDTGIPISIAKTGMGSPLNGAIQNIKIYKGVV